MGMFDYINDFSCKCPGCGNKVSDFQSKDGECYLKNISYKEVYCFYASCQKCKAFIKCIYRPTKPKKLSGYRIYIDDKLFDAKIINLSEDSAQRRA